MFETEVLPFIHGLVNAKLWDDDTKSRAIAWPGITGHSETEFPAMWWGLCGIRAALAGRDLPGCGCSTRDVWAKLTHWQGAGMHEVVDRDVLALDGGRRHGHGRRRSRRRGRLRLRLRAWHHGGEAKQQ